MPETITLSKDRFKKVLSDFEILMEDVTALVHRDDIIKKRISDIENDPSIGRGEEDLKKYLKKRGVKVD